ncbi:hypothetical protein M405DRAFT_883500 [Rhizopogon salebrosus TDB-379]|nr:hypothetical protein M405DRAFT_883500 [Rhizopogon salebrosus TDB-379]
MLKQILETLCTCQNVYVKCTDYAWRRPIYALAKASFTLYANLLDRQRFFFGEQPTTLDIYLASHILLLLDPPLPDQLMRNILEELHPTLVESARNVQAEVSQIPQYPIAPAQKYSLLSLLPRPFSNPVEKKENQLDETDLLFCRMRWAWFALAFGGVVQLCTHTVIIGTDRRPRCVQTHEAGQADETVVSDEEGGGEDDGVHCSGRE